MGGTRIIEQWFKGYLGRSGAERDRLIDQRLGELERNLGEWYQALKFGPIPGSYFNFQLRNASDPIVLGVQQSVTLPPVIAGGGTFELRPIFFGIITESAPASPIIGNVLLPNDPPGQKLLVNDFNITGASSFQTNKRQDFAVDKVIVPPGSLFPAMSLDFSTVTDPNASHPTEAHMIFKGVSQVEP